MWRCPKVSPLAAAGPLLRILADFLALLRLSTYAAPSAAASPSLTLRNTLLPQCKIIRDKEQTEKHQALSDRPKKLFSIFESVPKDGLSSFWMTTKPASLGLK